MEKMAKVFSYSRFSDLRQQEGNSLDRQIGYAQQYAEANNMILDESLAMTDKGLSAYHQQHIKKGAFGVFLAAVESGKIASGSVLIIECLDRISRAEPIEAQAILSQIIMAGITVITASDNKVYEREIIRKDPMALVYSLLIFVRANEESEVKSKRVKKAIISKIQEWIDKGHGTVISNGRTPYWCTVKEDKTGFDLITERVKIIKEIISVYKKGWGFNKIVKYLNNSYDPFSGKRWYVQYITTLVRNRSLVGERTFIIDNEHYLIPNYYPAILTSAEFSDLQQMIKQRGSTKAQSKYPSLITGMKIAYCGLCNEVLSAQNYTFRERKGKLSDGFRRIRCIAESNGHKCLNTKSISIVPIEKAILNYCMDLSELHKMIVNDDNTVSIKADLAKRLNELDKIDTVLKNLDESVIELMEEGKKVSVRLNDMMDDYTNKRDEILKIISKLYDDINYYSRNKSTDIISEWQDYKDRVNNLDEEARLFIRQLIKRTFKRIDIFLHGMQLSDNPTLRLVKEALGTDENTIDLILTFHNDKTRILSIDKKTGSWVKGGDVGINGESMPRCLEEHQKTGRPVLT